MQTFSVIQSEWSAELKSLLRIGLLIAGHQSILIQGGWMIVVVVKTGGCDDNLPN